MNSPRWIVIIALALSLCIPATSVHAAPSASISLTAPAPDPVPVGNEVSFTLVITVTDINPGVSGADIYLGYNPALVEPPASPLSVAVALPDFFGISDISIKELLPAAQCPGGASPCVHLVVAGPAQTTHSGAAARFNFRAKAEGSACFSVLGSTLADANGFPVSHTAASSVCATIIRSGVAGIVRRQGTPANPNPGAGSLACSEVKATSGALTVGPASTDSSGNFKLTDVPGGTHTLQAKYPGYLASEKSITISTSGPPTVDVGSTTLRGGDVNGDLKINILDVGTIISKFGSTSVAVRSDSPDCSDSDEAADINDDGNINISDLAITAGNWGLTGPTGWQ